MPFKLVFQPKRFLISVGSILAVSLLKFAYDCRPINAPAEHGFTSPTLPSPNGYDLYIEAMRNLELKPVDKAIDDTPGARDRRPESYPLAPKEQWLRDNARGFEMFAAAQKVPYEYPSIRLALEGEDILPASGIGKLARCKEAESHIYGERGDSVRAVACALETWKLGLDAAHGTSLVPALYAMIVEVHARRPLNLEIAHLNTQQAAQAARQLEALLATRVPYREIIKTERNVSLIEQKERYVRMPLRDTDSTAYYNTPSNQLPGMRNPLVNYKVRRINALYAQGMDKLIAQADGTWPQYRAAEEAAKQQPDAESSPAKLFEVLGRSRFYYARSQAGGYLCLTRLALHAYRKASGVYPNDLNTLVPTYLKAVPTDPFLGTQPLRYRKEGKRYKLWSVGPDGQDNNATPADNPSARTPEGRHLVSYTSSGDMVANIND